MRGRVFLLDDLICLRCQDRSLSCHHFQKAKGPGCACAMYPGPCNPTGHGPPPAMKRGKKWPAALLFGWHVRTVWALNC